MNFYVYKLFLIRFRWAPFLCRRCGLQYNVELIYLNKMTSEELNNGVDVSIHPTSMVDSGVHIGTGTKIWHFSHVLKNTVIGKYCNIGQNVVAGPDVIIGNRCKIQNNVSVYKGVTLEDDVFCGPSVVFTNVFNPRSHIRRMDEIRPTLVKKGASLGANSTIVCGVTIGRYAFVGAGAVVTKDVSDYALVMGNPARQTGWVCECGNKLDPTGRCSACDKIFDLPLCCTVSNDAVHACNNGTNTCGNRTHVSGNGVDTPDEKNSRDNFTDIAFVDLTAQQKLIRGKIEKKIRTVLDHGRYIMGPEIAELEKQLAAFASVKHAIACASGTDALLMALMSCDIGKGDAVFTTPFTFAATAEVIRLAGAVPIFVDIDPDTFNISARGLEKAVKHIEASGNVVPKAVIPVDLFGLPCDYDEIDSIAFRYGLVVIADCAQSFGSEYKGKKAGTFGHISCTSFFPAKPLGCYGDGGAVFTDSDTLAEKLISIRVHGKGKNKYDNIRLGLNARMDTIQAAILLPKLEIFPDELRKRRQAAERYSKMLKNCDSILTLPKEPENRKSAWAQYSILINDKENRRHGETRWMLQAYLKANGIPTAIYYPSPLHIQPVYKDLGYETGDFPIAEDCASRILSLPMHPYLTKDDQTEICRLIKQYK